MNIKLISGSTRSESINRMVLHTVQNELRERGLEAEELLLTDYALPIYDQDLEDTEGFPEAVEILQHDLEAADGYVLCVPEHNGSMPVRLKNAIDWLSRKNRNIFGDRPVLLLSASPGARGAASALEQTRTLLGHMGGEVAASLSIGLFHSVFDKETRTFSSSEIEHKLNLAIQAFFETLQ